MPFKSWGIFIEFTWKDEDWAYGTDFEHNNLSIEDTEDVQANIDMLNLTEAKRC